MTGEPKDGRLERLLAEAGWLDRLARRLVADPAEADEVVQETWVAALKHRSRARSVRGWLAQIARNVVRQRGRSEGARRKRERSVARAEASEAEAEALDRAQAQQKLLAAVLALEEPYRGTVILHYFDHLEVSAVAQRLGVPESTVRTRLSRAVAELRARFEHKDGPNWALAFLPLAHSKAAVIAAPLIGGTLVASTWKIALPAALAAALTWLAWPSQTGLDAPNSAPPTSAEAARLDSPPELEQHAATDARAPLESETAPKAVASNTDRATLDVHLTWGDDHADAGNIGLELWLAGADDPFHDRRFARTDAEGRAHFDDLAPGHVNIETDRSDGACKLAPGEHATLELAIPDGIDVHGLVVDADDHPVAGARIWVSHYFNNSNGNDAATSDAGGAFLVRDVGRARYIGARHERYGPSVLEFLQEANPGQRIETRLVLGRECAEVSGVVHDAAGRPIAGASVELQVGTRFERDADGRNQGFNTAPEIARTDELGRFALRGIAVSPVLIVANAPGFAPGERSETLAAGTNQVEFTLARMAALHGRVVDAQGAALQGVTLGHGQYGGVASAVTTSRADGSYRLVGLPAGSIEVYVDGREKGTLRQTHQLHPGDDVEWQVQLVAKPGIHGRVVDAAGKPAAGFMVGAIQPEHPGLFLRNTKTDAEGRFELSDWPTEASAIEVREEGAWVGLPAAEVDHVQPGGEELRIQLADDALRSAYLAGRVLDENGKPVEAAEITPYVESSGQGQSLATDAEGRFRVGPLRPGRYYLQARVKGYAPNSVHGIVLAAGESKDLADLRLELPGEIEIHVRIPEGFDADHSWAYVALRGPDGEVRDSIEIKDGVGKLGGLLPGRYGLRFSCQWLRAEPTEVVVLARETSKVEFVALPGTERLVQLDPPNDAQGKRVHVRVLDGAGKLVYEDEFPFRTGQPMVFSEPGLVVGTYSVEASMSDGRKATGTLDVLSLEPVNTMLELAF
jgi:RNA polymerase sigma-70 factor (ECF subfamily)